MPSAATIGSLNAEFGLDTAKLDRGIERTRAKLTRLDFGKGVSAGLGDVEKRLGGMAAGAGIAGSALRGLGLAGVVAGAAITGAFNQARAAAAFGDEIADTAGKLAVSTDVLQEYRYAVHALGGEYRDADTALQGFSEAFGAAQGKLSAKALKPFAALGLDPDSFNTTEEALRAVTDRIADLGSTAEQAAIAKKLGLSSILPTLRAGTERLDALRAAAHRVGYVMRDDLIETAGDANDKFEDMSAILDVQVKSAMVEIAPLILSVADAMTQAARFTSQLFGALNDLNSWSGSDDLMAMFGWANNAGAAAGRFLGTDRIGAALQGRSGGYQPLADSVGESDDPLSMRMAAVGRADRKGGRSLIEAAGKGGGGGARQDNSEQAIAAAQHAELEARMALIGDLSQLAALRMQQVDDETAAENKKVAADVSINAAAKAKAIALNNEAAVARKALIEREALAQNEQDNLDQQETVGRYYTQVAAIGAAMASTAAERNQIERDSLRHEQRQETTRLQVDDARAVIAGDLLAGEAKQREIALADLHAAQLRQQAQEERARLAQEAADRAANGLLIEHDLLGAQADLTESSYARHALELKMLAIQQELERLGLDQIIASTTAGSVEHDSAVARRAILDDLHKTQTEVAKKGHTLAEAFQDGASAISGLKSAFGSQDWAGAANGLIKTFKMLKDSFGASGGKYAGLATAAGLAGGAIGGVGGAGIMGAVSGAIGGAALIGTKLGTAILPGVGTLAGAAIGAVVGGLASVLGASSAKKKAKREAAERARQEEEARLARVKAEADAQEIEILRLSGKEIEAVAMERRLETEAMDAGNRERQAQIYALRDEATARAKLADQAKWYADNFLSESERLAPVAMAVRTEMARLGQSGVTTKAQFRALVDGVDQTTTAGKALYAALLAIGPQFLEVADAAQSAANTNLETANDNLSQAQSALRDAFDQSSQELSDSAQRWRGVAAALRGTADELGQTLAEARSGPDRLAQAERRFQALAARVAGGDDGAVDEMKAAGEALIASAEASAGDNVALLRIVAQVKSATDKAARAADGQASVADQQLASLRDQVGQLIDLNSTARTISDLIANLQFALAAQQANQAVADNPGGPSPGPSVDLGGPAVTPAAPDPAAYLARYGDVAQEAAYQVALGAFATPVDYAAWHIDHFGIGEGRNIAGFATGGDWTVGGSGGIDSQLRAMRLTPGETVSIRRPGDRVNDQVVARLASIESVLMDGLGRGNATSRKILQKVDLVIQEGSAVRVTDVAA